MCLFVVVPGVALKCVVCNSGEKYQGKACEDPFVVKHHSDLVKDCNDLPEDRGLSLKKNYTMCRKFTQDG